MCSSFDKLYRLNMSDLSQSPIPLDKTFVMEVNYAWLGERRQQLGDYFLIDVVDFNNVDDFLNAIDSEAEAAKVIA
jgi:hypothetical protein